MNSARVYYTVAAKDADTIERSGLQPGPQGTHNIDSFLDDQRPATISVSRTGSIRGRLLYNGRLLDPKTGKLVNPKKHKLPPDTVRLAFDVEPQTAYVGDCAAYNNVAEAIERDAPPDAIRSLARAYWRRLIPLSDVLKHYDEDEESLVLKNKPDDESAFPCHLSDVEILIVGAVEPTRIQRLA